MRGKNHRFTCKTVNVKTLQSLFPITVTGNSEWKIFTFTPINERRSLASKLYLVFLA